MTGMAAMCERPASSFTPPTRIREYSKRQVVISHLLCLLCEVGTVFFQGRCLVRTALRAADTRSHRLLAFAYHPDDLRKIHVLLASY